MDARGWRLCGEEAWARFAAANSTTPFLSAMRDRAAADWRGIGWQPVVIGALLFGIMLLIHETAFGVAAIAL